MRRARLGVLVIGVLGMVSIALGALQIPSLQPVLGDVYVPLLASALISVVMGIASATLLGSPVPTMERTASRDLRPSRAFALAGLALYGVALMAISAAIHPENGALFREPAHFVGGLGLALLCMRWVAVPLAWCAMLAYALACLLAGAAFPRLEGVMLFHPVGSWPRLVVSVVVLLVAGALYVVNPALPASYDDQQWWQ